MLFGAKAYADPIASKSTAICIDQAWDAIYFLVTDSGSSSHAPLNILLGTGGTALGEDLGYGPARGLGPNEVVTLSEQISGEAEQTMRRRFSPERLSLCGVSPSFSGASPQH